MGLLAGLGNLLTGGLGKRAMGAVERYFPPDLSPTQKANIELAFKELEQREAQAAILAIKGAEGRFNQRIKDMEGTASDLKGVPILGPLVIFFRGLQRPVWGFATLWMDFKWFFGSGTFTEQQQTALIVINTLVLGFLFGERAIKNLTPLIVQVFGNKGAKDTS